MNINWKLRLSNKITLTAIILTVSTLFYQVSGILGIVPFITESELAETAGIIINLFVLLGIVVDPTTKGISDSKKDTV